ncbi:MAG: ribonuclease Z [Paludibacteraceae bacterium]|nr:ribonuclease Z [Paludibacteraceae bacterium]
MENFKLQILGSGSALPTKTHNQPSQVLSLREKSFMIDCGEGTQRQMLASKVKISRLNNIFISHLHGDHCFGLIGLISTLGMFNRTADLYIHSHPSLQGILEPLISTFCNDLTYKVCFEPFSPANSEVIYEDRSLTVASIPLKHKLPTSGFLFSEKERERNIIREKIDFYKIPLSSIPLIKQGADFVTEDGLVVPNAHLTLNPVPPKKYAYCSDTMYIERILPFIDSVDCLYHESTYLHEDLSKAKSTMHSTALQAATLASKANVKQLLLGHFSARYDDFQPFLEEAKSIFPNTHLCQDGDRIEF